MQAQATPTYPELRRRSGTIVVDGYGITLRVHQGRLHISDGIGDERRERTLSRSSREVKRIVLLGHTGYLTLEAIRWLTDVGIGFAQIDTDGRLIATSAIVGNNDPRLRRVQALATVNGVGLDVARDLIRTKITGQARVLAGRATADLSTYLAAVEDAPSIGAIRTVEAAAALAYWKSLAETALRFDKASEKTLPDHWRTIGVRNSGLSSGSRLATNPANSVLNYCYALAEAECRLALSAVGLDPGLGVLHADQKSRDSMALDLLEVVRPSVDGWVFDLFETRTFRTKDFHETRQGSCRILAPLTHVLAETLPLWRREAGPAAERVAKAFAASRDLEMSTPLTQSNRSRGRGTAPLRAARKAGSGLPRTCRGCGEPSAGPQNVYCRRCAAERDPVGAFAMSGVKKLAELRAAGKDPSASGAARGKVGATNTAHNRRRADWEQAHGQVEDVGAFRRDVLPKIQEVSLLRLARATGLSRTYCAKIRKGLVVPHPMHWEALAGSAAGESSPPGGIWTPH